MNMDVTALAAACCAIVLAFFKGSGFKQAINDLKNNVVYEDRFVEYKDANKEQRLSQVGWLCRAIGLSPIRPDYAYYKTRWN